MKIEIWNVVNSRDPNKEQKLYSDNVKWCEIHFSITSVSWFHTSVFLSKVILIKTNSYERKLKNPTFVWNVGFFGTETKCSSTWEVFSACLAFLYGWIIMIITVIIKCIKKTL